MKSWALAASLLSIAALSHSSPDFGNEGGGGGGLTLLGSTVSGGDANGVLFLNSSSQSATTPNFTYNSTTGILSIGGASSSVIASTQSTLSVAVGSTPSTFTFTSAGALTLNTLTASSMSIVDARNASFGAVTAGSTSTVTWTETIDRIGEFVTSSFTATSAGFYRISAEAGASQTAGTGCLLIKVNGSTIADGDECATGATALATVIPISINRVLSLSANDIVRIDASATTANVTFLKMHLTVNRIP